MALGRPKGTKKAPPPRVSRGGAVEYQGTGVIQSVVVNPLISIRLELAIKEIKLWILYGVRARECDPWNAPPAAAGTSRRERFVGEMNYVNVGVRLRRLPAPIKALGFRLDPGLCFSPGLNGDQRQDLQFCKVLNP